VFVVGVKGTRGSFSSAEGEQCFSVGHRHSFSGKRGKPLVTSRKTQPVFSEGLRQETSSPLSSEREKGKKELPQKKSNRMGKSHVQQVNLGGERKGGLHPRLPGQRKNQGSALNKRESPTCIFTN